MRKGIILVATLLTVFLMAAWAETEEKPWFDMDNCGFCSKMSGDLMKNMTWDQFEISNGLLVLTTVKPEFKEQYDKAVAEMKQLGDDMMSGIATDVKLCGHCQYYGKMMESGVKFEHITTKVGDIELITTDDEEVLKMIQEYAHNNKIAIAKMEEEEHKKMD